MTWYADLSNACMAEEGEHVRAISWLSDKHPFPTGESPPEFLARLKEFCQHWQEGVKALCTVIFMGVHFCELCDEQAASGNIGVPAGPILYVAPELIAHYVEAHQYLPPAEFIVAVMNAPIPGTPEYVDAVAPFRTASLTRLSKMQTMG